jgi:hypothetical protein
MAEEAAVSAVESGQAIGPDQEPITDPEVAQSYIQQESLKPFPFENYQSHLDVHSLFMKSTEFEALPLPVQQQFVGHYEATLQAMLSIQKPIEYKPVSPTLQIKATAGPSAISKILEKAGADVSAEDMAEPPVETWVSDSIDKVDQDEAGNDPLTPLDMQLKQQEIQTKLADAAIRSGTIAQENQRKSEQHGLATEAHDQRMLGEHSVLPHKEREAKAKADLAEKKLRQSDFRKPKPKAGK